MQGAEGEGEASLCAPIAPAGRDAGGMCRAASVEADRGDSLCLLVTLQLPDPLDLVGGCDRDDRIVCRVIDVHRHALPHEPRGDLDLREIGRSQY